MASRGEYRPVPSSDPEGTRSNPPTSYGSIAPPQPSSQTQGQGQVQGQVQGLLQRPGGVVVRRFTKPPLLSRHAKVLLSVLASVLVLCALIYHWLFSAGSGCLPAPYLYLSHHGAKNVMKISRDGCLVKSKVLWGNFKNSDLRGMAVGSYNGQEALYVLDARSSSSQLLLFSGCSYFSGMRSFMRPALESDHHPGLSHPYALALHTARNSGSAGIGGGHSRTGHHAAQTVFVTSQHTDVLQWFDGDTFAPKTFPQEFRRTYSTVNNATVPPSSRFYNGTFLQFGQPGQHKDWEQGVRGVIAVDQEVWVANEDLHRVFVLHAETGALLGSIPVQYPIGLHVSPEDTHTVFIGYRNSFSKHKNNNNNNHTSSSTNGDQNGADLGGVWSVDRRTLAKRTKFSLLSMRHPTGIVAFDGVLYVADQSAQSIFTFNISTGKFIRSIATAEDVFKGVGELEHLALSYC